MKILLDNDPKSLKKKSEKFDYDFWQLRTPLTRHKLAGQPYGLDNGCFAHFRKSDWLRLVAEAEITRPLFVCAPDIVGDAVRTLDLFDAFKQQLSGLPLALVLQDGIGQHRIPWHEISAVFVGGSDQFKISAECFNCIKAAKYLNKWVHIGRVNTPERVDNFLNIGDSLDGSGISRRDDKLERVLNAVTGRHPQQKLWAIQ